jgi:hypothetical protein
VLRSLFVALRHRSDANRDPPRTSAASYSFGGAPPLDLAFVAGLLDAQVQRSVLAFEAFKKLISEQEASIAGNNPDPASVT